MDALTLLRAAGWHPGREVDTGLDVAALGAEGFEVTEAAERFLREYSGLTISSRTNPNPLIIDGLAVAPNADVGWCELYSEAIGSTLVPVGEYSSMVLYVDQIGGIWGGFDNDYGRGGSSLEEIVSGLFIDQPGWRFDRRIELD
jgi:hypothetical protein